MHAWRPVRRSFARALVIACVVAAGPGCKKAGEGLLVVSVDSPTMTISGVATLTVTVLTGPTASARQPVLTYGSHDAGELMLSSHAITLGVTLPGDVGSVKVLVEAFAPGGTAPVASGTSALVLVKAGAETTTTVDLGPGPPPDAGTGSDGSAGAGGGPAGRDGGLAGGSTGGGGAGGRDGGAGRGGGTGGGGAGDVDGGAGTGGVTGGGGIGSGGLGGPCAVGSFACANGVQPLQCNAQTHVFEKSGPACDGTTPDCDPVIGGACWCYGTVCSNACVRTYSDAHHCGSCTTDCKFGTCLNGVCQPERIGNSCSSLAVDTAAVYCISNGTVRRTPIGGQQALFPDAGAATVTRLTVDGNGTLYYMQGQVTATSTINLMRVPTSGGTPTMMTTAHGPVAGMVVRDGILYWTENGIPSNNVPSQVVKVPTTAQAQAATVIATGLFSAGDLAVDNSHVYWGCGLGLQTVPRDVTGPTDPALPYDTTSVPGIVVKSLIFDGKFVLSFVYSQTSAAMYRTSYTPDLVEASVAVYRNLIPGGLASDGVNAYFASTIDGTIVKQPVDGSASSTYDTGAASHDLGELVMDATTIYFVNGVGLYRIVKF